MDALAYSGISLDNFAALSATSARMEQFWNM